VHDLPLARSRRWLRLAFATVVALAIPAVLLGNGLWLLTNSWYVHAEYARPGFPDDRYGFTKEQRTALALVGLDSIHPFNGDGVQVLRDARLPGGGPAFNEREIAHMDDVRGVVGNVLLGHLIALATIVLIWIVNWRLRLPGVMARGFFVGGLLTLGVAALLGIYMLVNFDDFFVQFHQALFEGDSWRFPSSDTLIRLYPDAFWSDFGGVLAGLTVLQAVLLSGGVWWSRRRRTRAAAGLSSEFGDELMESPTAPRGSQGVSGPVV
jgi:integral membrane protein (TIGR01906 family)